MPRFDPNSPLGGIGAFREAPRPEDPTTLGPGAEGLLSLSRQARQFASEQLAKRTGPIPAQPKPGGPIVNVQPGVQAGAQAAAALLNPLPENAADLGLAAIPFARVMGRVVKDANRMFVGIPSGMGPQEYVKDVIAPKLMNLVSRANRAQVDFMDMDESAKWLDENIRRGVRDAQGNIHWGADGTWLHADIIEDLETRGIDMSNIDLENFSAADRSEMFFDFGFGQPVDYDTGTNLEMAFSNYFTEITGRSPTPFASSLSTDLAIGARAGTARPAEGLRRVEEDPRAVERELRTAAGPAGGAATIRGADEINTGLEPNISDIVSKEGLVPAGLRPVGQAKYTVWKREPGGRIRAVGTSDDLEAATLNAEREMFEMDQDMFAVDPTEITDASLMPGGDKWKAGFGSINSDAETFVTGPGARIRSTD